MTVSENYRLKICQCFQGPVHQAFVYTYYQAYTQDTDVFTYINKYNLQVLFTQVEITKLQKEKRPNFHGFSVLFKVRIKYYLKFYKCCNF